MQVYRIDAFGSIDALQVREENVPEVGNGQVLVRVHASSLNFRDLLIVQGLLPFGPVEGRVPNSDGAGEIVAVGENVTRFKVGDKVIGTFFPNWFGGRQPKIREQYMIQHDGWLTEYKVLNAEALSLMPDHLTFEEASTLPCAALTAWSSLEGVNAGDTVLTLGTGGVSIFAIQLAKAMGAKVIATTSSYEKFDQLKAIGADEIINYREEPQWSQVVRKLTNGQGVDRIVEVGGPATIAQSVKSIVEGGQVSLVGALGHEGESIDIMQLFFSRATYKAIGVGSRDDLEEMNRVISLHKIHPVIDRQFAFNDTPAAYKYLADRNIFGKVVISYDSN